MPSEEQESQDSVVEETEPAADSNVDTGEEPTESELELTIAERDRAVAEKEEAVDLMKRAQAEFENARKRILREQDELREYAAMSTIESLLPIVDDFDRAIEEAVAVDPDYVKGLELIRDRILEVFHRAGLEHIDANGQFDPHHHQAVDRAPAETDEDDQLILDVYRKGYRFKERLLRPAMVKVAVKE